MKSLSELKKANLEEYEFPGTDAAVLNVEKNINQKELEDAFRGISGQHRFYPSDSGWKVKFPYWYIKEITSRGKSGFKLQDFAREAKGWDHEHCSFCQAHIIIGDKAYTHPHEDGGVYVLCLKCAEMCK